MDYPIDKEKLFDCWISANKEKVEYGSRFFQEKDFVRTALKCIGIKTEHIRKLWPEMLGAYRKSLKEIIEADTRNKEVRELLEFLKNKGKKIGVFSNGRTGNVETWLSWAGITSNLFDFILSSEEIEIQKPDMRVFGVIADRMNEDPENCVYVGDSPTEDITPAIGYGMKAILYKPPKEATESVNWKDYTQVSSPDLIIEDISDLKEIII